MANHPQIKYQTYLLIESHPASLGKNLEVKLDIKHTGAQPLRKILEKTLNLTDEHQDYIITIYVKANDLEKALKINEIADIIYGHDQNIIENVYKELEENYEKIDSEEVKSDEEYEDAINKFGKLFVKILLYCFYLFIIIICIYLFRLTIK